MLTIKIWRTHALTGSNLAYGVREQVREQVREESRVGRASPQLPTARRSLRDQSFSRINSMSRCAKTGWSSNLRTQIFNSLMAHSSCKPTILMRV